MVGAGTLGTQIAAHLLVSGAQVVLRTRFPENVAAARQKVGRLLDRYPEKEGELLDSLQVLTDCSGLNGCSAIIEAVSEDLSTKLDVLRDIERSTGNGTHLFTNSSSISIDTLASGLERPERFLGFHLFNPVRKMDLVEIVVGKSTGQGTIECAGKLAVLMGKEAVTVRNSPGFIVNRLLLWQINEAARMVEEGVTSMEDIDKAVRLGLNHPMGPFQLADLIGLDVCLSILRTLDSDLGLPGYSPSPLLIRHVEEGRLGKKAGRGFYEY